MGSKLYSRYVWCNFVKYKCSIPWFPKKYLADIWETSCVPLRPRFSRKFTFWGLTGIGISAFMAPSEPPFAQGDIKSCKRISFAIKEKFLGWDYIIISLYHFIRRTNAMQWYGLDNIHLLYSFHPSSLSDFAKLFDSFRKTLQNVFHFLEKKKRCLERTLWKCN